jgi:hypothetical protein
MKEYGYLLRDDPGYREKAERFSALVKDAGEFLGDLGLEKRASSRRSHL